MSNIPITPGSGAASVATETVGGLNYQKIEVVSGGGASVLGINPDGTVNASIVGTPTVQLSGGNTSVSGTLGSSIIGTVPITQSGKVIASISGVVDIAGSVVAAVTFPANQSVSGAVAIHSSVITAVQGSVLAVVNSAVNIGNFPSIQDVSGSSVIAEQGTSPWIITGSVQGSFAPVANQSVSGTVNVGNLPTTQNVSGSVVASQGTNPWVIVGSVQGTFSPVANQSVSGTVNVGNFPATQPISGSVAVLQGTNPLIITGSVQGNFSPAANQSVSGTVGVTQSTTPWIITGSVQGSFSPAANQSVSGTVGASVIGTVPVVQSGTTITSLVSTIPSSVIVGTSVFGQLPAGTAVLGSIATLQGTNPWVIVGSVYGSGSVAAFQAGTRVTSLVSTVPSSVIVGASIFGLAPVNITNTNVNVSGSVVAFNTSTNASFISVSKDSSVIAVLSAPSIVGTYAEDAAHTTADKGLFVMQVRNDTMSSVTSADGDYSPFAGGPVGERIVANAPITKWVQGTADLRGNSGASVAIIAAQGASIFTYITGLQVANMGSASVLVTLSGATSSVIGYTIAPAGGGSNILYPNALKTNANGAFTASISGVASVLVSAQGFISKT